MNEPFKPEIVRQACSRCLINLETLILSKRILETHDYVIYCLTMNDEFIIPENFQPNDRNFQELIINNKSIWSDSVIWNSSIVHLLKRNLIVTYLASSMDELWNITAMDSVTGIDLETKASEDWTIEKLQSNLLNGNCLITKSTSTISKAMTALNELLHPYIPLATRRRPVC